MQTACALDEHGRLARLGEPGDVPWWSFSKTVLATAALRLADPGVLALDAPVAGERYTLRQLLRHEAGVANYGRLADYHAAVARGEAPWPVSELLARLDAGRLRFEPGQAWAYSNVGYLKVGQILAEDAGRPLETVLRELVLRPAGAERARLAQVPSDLQGVNMGTAPDYHPGWVYHGLLVGDLADAARILRWLLGGDALSPQMFAAMVDARRMPEFRNALWREPGYGLGLMTPILASGRQLFGHTGDGPGSRVAAYGLARGERVAAAWASADAEMDVEAEAARLLTG